MMKTRTARALTLLLISTAFIACTEETANKQKPLVVFLVRHAEKMDDSRDPDLSPEGFERVQELSKILRDANIDYVHGTDFIRTRDTAAGVASQSGLDVKLYDYRDLVNLRDMLVQIGGRHLVVGHSNTTPVMVELLGGQPGSAIDEESEYDRLYIVTVGEDGTASTVLLRYGIKYKT